MVLGIYHLYHRQIYRRPPLSDRSNSLAEPIALFLTSYRSYHSYHLERVLVPPFLPSHMAEEMEHKHFDSFRPNKRRKFYRRRSDTPDERAVVAAPSAAAIPPQPLTVDELIAQNGPEELQLSVTEIVRQRKAAQRRRGGIEFTNLNISSSAVPQSSDALVETEDGVTADIKSVIDRFAPQTGQVSEAADKHM